MQFIIRSNLYINGINTLLAKAIEKELTFDNPEYEKKRQLGLSLYGTPKKVRMFTKMDNGTWKVPIGYAKKVLHLADFYDLPYDKVDQRVKGSAVSIPMSEAFKLRDYQEELRDTAEVNETGVLVSPAGSGKTITGMGIISKTGRRTLWLTHTKDLLFQTAEVVRKTLRTTVGVLGGGKELNMDAPVIVATVQTLLRRPHLLKEFKNTMGLVIVDECHLVPSSMFTEVLDQLPSFRKYGLTATPNRKDGKDYLITAYCGEVLKEMDRSILYEEGKLLIPTVKAVYSDFKSTNAIKVSGKTIDLGGDEGEGYPYLVSQLLEDEKRLDLVADTIKDIPKEETTLVIGDRINYLERLLTKCGGIILTGKHSNTYRELAIEGMRTGENKLMFATTQLVKEGLDIQRLTNLVIVTPMAGDKKGTDGSSLEQAVGRIMRVDPNNPAKKPTVYDIVDYDNETFKRQYYSRRRVYKRLGMTLPKKQRKTMTEELADIIF